MTLNLKNPNAYLANHLLEAKSVSGPPIKSINNSGLGYIKRILSGGAPFLGGERYLVFGTEFHLRCLIRRKGKWKACDENEKKSMDGMVKSLYTCKLFTDSFPGSVREKLHKQPNVFGIHGMHGTIDLKKRKRRGKIIIDLKTTSAKTEAEFITKAIKLDYPRQGVVYEQLDDPQPEYDETYFIGISRHNAGTEKKPFYPHWVLDLNNYQKEKEYATSEAKFLLQFGKDFGLPKSKRETTEKYTVPNSRG